MAAASSSSSTPTAAPSLISFARGTIATLKAWPALRIAVEGGWGGPESEQKRLWLSSAIVDAFEDASNKNDIVPDAIYVEEMLLQVLSDEFDVVLEDGSARPVATGIVNLWQEIMNEGRTDGVVRVEALAKQLQGKKIVVDHKDASDEWEDEADDSEDEEDGSEDENEEAPQLLDTSNPRREEPEVDEDGFTVVKRGSRR